ncbi:hypothetical protein ACQ4M3_39740 [Leptolyngbya sp. AN03gr2]|uniref:hypothetical protein n=1 Tax=unclassified Leptolyngbya TaxID=2650499 RepID=UPI003D31F6ED
MTLEITVTEDNIFEAFETLTKHFYGEEVEITIDYRCSTRITSLELQGYRQITIATTESCFDILTGDNILVDERHFVVDGYSRNFHLVARKSAALEKLVHQKTTERGSDPNSWQLQIENRCARIEHSGDQSSAKRKTTVLDFGSFITPKLPQISFIDRHLAIDIESIGVDETAGEAENQDA